MANYKKNELLPTGEYKRIKLPYELNELEWVISFQTMHFHYNILHKNYEIKLLEMLKGTKIEQQFSTLEKLMENLDKLPTEIEEDIRFFGGGLINHNFFFAHLTKMSEKNEEKINPDLLENIKKDLEIGSLEELKRKLVKSALKVRGKNKSKKQGYQQYQIQAEISPKQTVKNKLPTDINCKDSAKSIDEHAIEIFNQIWGSSEGRGYTINNLPFSSEESIKYSKVKSEDEKEEKELDNLEKEKNSLKKLKVVKANIKDQDIVNLQKKVTDLTKLKKETEKQLKEKEQQITTLSNHKCDTPQGKELNLWKERVIKLTTEKDKLQSQLEQKEKNNSNSKGANYSHWILGGIVKFYKGIADAELENSNQLVLTISFLLKILNIKSISSAEERLPYKQRVAGSIPAYSTIDKEYSEERKICLLRCEKSARSFMCRGIEFLDNNEEISPWEEVAVEKKQRKKKNESTEEIKLTQVKKVKDGESEKVFLVKNQEKEIFFEKENEKIASSLSEEQKKVFYLAVREKENIFFTGAAGTGKSFLLKRIIAALQLRYGRERVAVTALTGIAAVNINGTTLHSFSGIGLEVLVIDEISMLEGDLLDKLEIIARTVRNNSQPFGGLQLIFCGDFFQLPPSENKLIKLLNEIRFGEISPEGLEVMKELEEEPKYPNDGIKAIQLSATNEEVSPNRLSEILRGCLAPSKLQLKLKSQVMLIKNLSPQLVNGSQGIVVGFQEQECKINHYDQETRKKNVKIPYTHIVQASRQQIPLILSWAITIHKSQGQSIERLKINCRSIFAEGQLYVALSRATSVKYLQVIGFRENHVMLCLPKVNNFYQNLLQNQTGVKNNIIGKKAQLVEQPPCKRNMNYDNNTHTHRKNTVAFAKKTITVAKKFAETVSNDTDLN
ncbi:2670_t:CDS:10 [Funneliformis geosporum]|uniref:ATP-dependent DNA helicase n=1 Tax=Funneliformis geosporum TaxID=1117311 RepID=A0A9W4WJ48_9GLOM|nr:2670_t:CDS:10 [Funneliformis geosporum]